MPGSAITIAIKSFCLSYSPSFRTTFQFNLRTNYLFGQFQVSHMDNSMMSVLQFAVEALKVPHIVVCGHYECGGAKASLSQTDHTPPLSVWLRNIRDVQVRAVACSGLLTIMNQMNGFFTTVFCAHPSVSSHSNYFPLFL